MTQQPQQIPVPQPWEWWALAALSLALLVVISFAVAYLNLGVVSIYAHALVIPALGFMTVPLMFIGLLRTIFRPPAIRRSRTIAFGALIVAGILGNNPMFPAPVSTHDVQLSQPYRLPVQGEWTALAGGPDKDRNYHATTSAHRWAYDLTLVKDGKKFNLDGARNEDYFAFGKPVFSPINGKVVVAETGLSDNTPGQADAILLGNHLVIEVTPSEFLVLAHLKQSSIKVKVGESVAAGQHIADVGNSGRSIEPHLHIHVQNSPNFPFSESIPLSFTDVTINGTPAKTGTPLGNSDWDTLDGDRVAQIPVQ